MHNNKIAMKKSLLILSSIIIASGIILTGCNQPAPEKTEAVDPIENIDLSNGAVASHQHGKMAYIFVDTLLIEYKFYKVLEDKLAAKQSSLEANFNRKKKEFEDEYVKFMEKVQRGTFLSQERAQEAEQELAMQQQNLALYEQDISREIMQEGQQMEKQLIDTVVNFLKEFNSDKRYDYILNAASCLYVDETMDITDTVVNSLNKRYETYLQTTAAK